jgi:hypothetical protein
MTGRFSNQARALHRDILEVGALAVLFLAVARIVLSEINGVLRTLWALFK